MIAVTKATAGMRMAPACAFAPQEENLTYFYSDHSLDKVDYGYPQPLWNGSSVLGFNYVGSNKYMAWLCRGWDSDADIGGNCDRNYAQSLLSSNGTW